MSSSGIGEKRGSLKFIPGLTLSQHPPGQRKQLFMNKLDNIIVAKSLHRTEFQGYTIRERFQKMGWEELLNFSCDKIYRRVVIQWVASLSRNGDELTGTVDGKSYTITPAIVRDLLGVDTRKDSPYTRFNEADFRITNVENNRRLQEALKTVFGIKENAKKVNPGYKKSNMTPIVQILWQIGVWTFHPRLVTRCVHGDIIFDHEIYRLHALFTGDPLYSFAHLMIDDIWDMYEDEHQRNIPHGYYLSEILNLLGAVSKDEYVEIISPQCREISRRMFYHLRFSESSTEYIIDDSLTEQRVTFPKVIEKEPQPSIPQTLSQQVVLTRLLISLQNLINTQSSESRKQHNEMMTVVTNIQKQMERQELEAERREQKRKRGEQERERKAELQTHAIIWDVERQRYFYEQEQEQVHKAWNKAYRSEAFQFPQISHTSLHPPQSGSRYYDPNQGNEIPKAFQDIFHDIYGTS